VPQFARSVSVFVQLVSQSVGVVPPQVRPQVPPAQTSPSAHPWPHVPQFSRSVSVITQTLPHATSLEVHESSQLEPLQTKPGSHAWPHVPQFARSLVMSAQYGVPPGSQVVSDAAQLTVHVPRLQTSPDAQSWPHRPQFSRSVSRLKHAPPHASWPVGQSV
jgi:hypothetical protein